MEPLMGVLVRLWLLACFICHLVQWSSESPLMPHLVASQPSGSNFCQTYCTEYVPVVNVSAISTQCSVPSTCLSSSCHFILQWHHYDTTSTITWDPYQPLRRSFLYHLVQIALSLNHLNFRLTVSVMYLNIPLKGVLPHLEATFK